MPKSIEIHLSSALDGMPREGDFAEVERNVVDPCDGKIQIQNLFMSVDPAMRPRLSRGPERNEVGGRACRRGDPIEKSCLQESRHRPAPDVIPTITCRREQHLVEHRLRAGDDPRVHRGRLSAAQAEVQRGDDRLVKSARIKFQKTIVDGVDNAPRALIALPSTESIGKMPVKMSA